MFRRFYILIIPLVLLLVLAMRIPAHAQYKHKRLFTDRFLHSPARNDNCTVCHDVHFSDKPGQLADLQPRLCFRCHEGFMGKNVHRPVKKGDCNTCHYPHSSPRRNLLTAPADSLCKKCHGSMEKKLHGDVNITENCIQCHDPHSTNSEKLLRQIPPESCRSCHEQLLADEHQHSAIEEYECVDCHNPHSVEPEPVIACDECHDEILGGKLIHSPAEEDCGNCHETHSGPVEYQLFSSPPDLCLECHDSKAGGKHGRVTLGEDCMGCHSPHSSDQSGLLTKGVQEVNCTSCHKKGHQGSVRHSALEEYDCSECHDPHGEEPVQVAKCTDCHDDLLTGKRVHSPAGEGCGNCHQTHTSEFPYQLTVDPTTLCIKCHEGRQGGKHGTVTLGEDCVRCHNPHSSDKPKLLELTTDAAACKTCHVLQVRGSVLHTPVSEWDCNECHDPHVDPPTGKPECADCHDDLLDERVKHEPAVEGCDNCHESHSAEREKLLNEEHPALCINCHDDREQGEHGRVLMSTDCLNCHLPHSSSRNSLLRDLADRRCVSCHSGKTDKQHVHTALSKYECGDCHNPHIDPSEMPPLSCEECHLNISDISPHHRAPSKGRCVECHDPHSSEYPFQMKKLDYTSNEDCLECHVVIKRKLRLGKSIHRPVKEGECIRCHTIHIGETPFTREQFTTRMTIPYSQEAYTLCFTCHSFKLVQTQYTQVETEFRHGSMNLHFSHVLRDGRNGYSCWVCHDAHASPQPRLINPLIPFNPGNYPLRIRFEKSDNGGRCTTNCHVVREYRR